MNARIILNDLGGGRLAKLLNDGMLEVARRCERVLSRMFDDEVSPIVTTALTRMTAPFVDTKTGR